MVKNDKATKAVRVAIKTTIHSKNPDLKGYFENTVNQRLENGAGSYYAGMSANEIKDALKKAEWSKVTDPEILKNVMPGCDCYVTSDIPNGRNGMRSIDSMPDYTFFMAIDPKGTGIVSLAAVSPDRGIKEKSVAEDKTYLIVGDEKGEKVVFTFHPGEPVRPSLVPVENLKHGTLLSKQEAKNYGFDMTKTMSKDAMLQEYTKVMEKKYWNPNRQDNLNQQSVFYQLHPEWQLYDTRSAIAYRIAHDLNFANTKWIEDLQKDIKNLKNQYCGITVYYNGDESQYYEGELPLNMKQFNDIRPVLDNAYQTLSEMQANHVDSWETNYQGEVSSKDFTTLDYAEIEDDIKHCQEQYKEKAIEVDEERKNNGTKYYTLDGKLKIFTLFDSCQKDDIDIKTIDGISAGYHEFDERGFTGNYVSKFELTQNRSRIFIKSMKRKM